jgi:ABC-type multidrug transport system ATPase subunit
LLEIKNFRYKVGKNVSPIVNFKALDHSMNLIVGNNGEGKTLLFNTLCGQNSLVSGECYINSVRTNLSELKIAYAPVCDYEFYTMKVSSYISYLINVYDLIESDVYNLIKLFRMEKHLNTKVFKLSDGERRRFSIIETEMMGLPICFYDEPEANLDASFRDVLLNHLTKQMNKKTIFLISHYPDIYKEISSQVLSVNMDKAIVLNSSSQYGDENAH